MDSGSHLGLLGAVLPGVETPLQQLLLRGKDLLRQALLLLALLHAWGQSLPKTMQMQEARNYICLYIYIIVGITIRRRMIIIIIIIYYYYYHYYIYIYRLYIDYIYIYEYDSCCCQSISHLPHAMRCLWPRQPRRFADLLEGPSSASSAPLGSVEPLWPSAPASKMAWKDIEGKRYLYIVGDMSICIVGKVIILGDLG